MNDDINVVFFDLFFTLVTPKYNDLRNENDVLKITQTEWEKYSEDKELYLKRATGKEKSPQKIIEDIIKKMKINATKSEKEEILKLREDRFKKSLINVDFIILDVLSDIKKKGKKICLISNTDIIDVMHWEKSPLNTDELKGAKVLGIKTILTEYLIKRDKKQHNEIKKFADYFIEDFNEIKNIIK